MLSIIAAVLPVVLAIAIGVLCRRFGMLDADSAGRLNRLVYWILFPCLLVVKLGTSPSLRGDEGVALDFPWASMFAMWGAIAVTMAVFFGFGRGAGLERIGSLFSTAFRSNGAFIGLPLSALLADNLVIGEREVTLYLFLLAGIIPTFNIMSVVGFVLPRHGLGWRSLLPSLIGLLKNPILWGCLLGLLASQIPERIYLQYEDGVIERSLWLLGRPAIPLALIAAGASLRFDELTSVPLEAWFASLWKLLMMPLMALVLAKLFGVADRELAVLMVLAVCPSAVAIVPMASVLDGDVRLAATGVVLTTLLAPVSMVVWLFWVLG